MPLHLFKILRAVLATLVSAIAAFIIDFFDQCGGYDYSHEYE